MNVYNKNELVFTRPPVWCVTVNLTFGHTQTQTDWLKFKPVIPFCMTTVSSVQYHVLQHTKQHIQHIYTSAQIRKI